MKWEPIETAPKDGTAVLVYAKPYVELAVSRRETWWVVNYIEGAQCNPTHWMPLPEPPDA